MTYKKVHFFEDRYCVKSIESKEDQAQAHRLRHQVFCETLEWVPSHPSGMEIDRYDVFSISLGVFSESGTLLALARLLPPDQPFMLETEFSGLLPPSYEVRKESDTVEITRLAVTPSINKLGRFSRRLPMILYKGIYRWSLMNGIRYAYIVVEKRFWRAILLSGFPCVPIGPAKPLPPAGVESMAAMIDAKSFPRERIRFLTGELQSDQALFDRHRDGVASC